METLNERSEMDCIDLIANISATTKHRLHNLQLPDRVKDKRQRETRTNVDVYNTFKFKTDRFN